MTQKDIEIDFNQPKPNHDVDFDNFNFFEKVKQSVINPRYHLKNTIAWCGGILSGGFISLGMFEFYQPHLPIYTGLVLGTLYGVIGLGAATKAMLLYKENQDFPKNIKKTHATLLGITAGIFLLLPLLLPLNPNNNLNNTSNHINNLTTTTQSQTSDIPRH